MSTYIVASTFIFLSTIWSTELWLELKGKLDSGFKNSKPLWVRACIKGIEKITGDKSVQLVYFGAVFIALLPVPLWLRIKDQHT